MKIDRIMLLLIFAFVLIVGAMIYFNTGSRVDVTGNIVEEEVENLVAENQAVQEPEKELKKHVPLELDEEDILVSFRIDDITFRTGQRKILENALYLARKYNVTFDLAVIAKSFNELADPKVFNIYHENQDVFEVVAHGLTHSDYQNETCYSTSCFVNKSCGEFKCASYEQQEEHIKKMKDIFEKHNLYWGTKIFALPWSAGDKDTIILAEKQRYNLIIQFDVPDKKYEWSNGKIRVSKSYVAAALNETLTDKEVLDYQTQFIKLVKDKQNNVEIVMHPINFYKVGNSEELIKQFVEIKKSNNKIKFGMIGDGFAGQE